MKIIEANTVLQTIKPWIFITTICGLRPYNLTPDGDRIALSFSYVYFSYSIAIISTEFTVLFWVANYVFTYNVIGINSYITNLDFCGTTFFWSVANLISLWKYKDYIYILNKVSVIDRGFKEIGVALSYKRDKKELLMSLGFAILITCNFYFHSSYFYSNEVKFPPIAYYLDILVSSTRHWFVIQMVQIVNFLKFRYRHINSELKNLAQGNIDSINKVFTVGPKDYVFQIYSLRKLCDELYEVAEMVNGTFGVRLMIYMAIAWEIILANAYYFITSLIKGVKVGNIVFGNVYDTGTMVLEFAILVVYLINSFGGTVEAADKTGILAGRLLIVVKDKDTVKELQLFSQQLLHAKVKFTACGLFSLDYSLLLSIVGVTTTYLIIMIQFYN